MVAVVAITSLFFQSSGHIDFSTQVKPVGNIQCISWAMNHKNFLQVNIDSDGYASAKLTLDTIFLKAKKAY